MFSDLEEDTRSPDFFEDIFCAYSWNRLPEDDKEINPRSRAVIMARKDIDWRMQNKEIAERFNLAASMVSSARKELGLPQAENHYKWVGYKDKIWAKIKRIIDKSGSKGKCLDAKIVQKISSKVGFTTYTIRKYLKQHGYKSVNTVKKRKVDIDKIDWSLSNVEIAKRQKVRRETIGCLRRKMGIPNVSVSRIKKYADAGGWNWDFPNALLAKMYNVSSPTYVNYIRKSVGHPAKFSMTTKYGKMLAQEILRQHQERKRASKKEPPSVFVYEI